MGAGKEVVPSLSGARRLFAQQRCEMSSRQLLNNSANGPVAGGNGSGEDPGADKEPVHNEEKEGPSSDSDDSSSDEDNSGGDEENTVDGNDEYN